MRPHAFPRMTCRLPPLPGPNLPDDWQGPPLPQADALPLPLLLDRQGFVMESEAAGIFAAGCAVRPMNVAESVRSGAAAVTRALGLSARPCGSGTRPRRRTDSGCPSARRDHA